MLPSLLTPVETQTQLAQRLKNIRLLAGYKRSTLAARSGVTESSLKRFENSGEISLKNLLRLAHALGCLHEFAQLCQPAAPASLAELKQSAEIKIPGRGRF